MRTLRLVAEQAEAVMAAWEVVFVGVGPEGREAGRDWWGGGGESGFTPTYAGLNGARQMRTLRLLH